MINPHILSFIPSLIEIFKKNKVKDAYLFGSAITEKFNDESDVDFLINFQDNLAPLEKGELWWILHDSIRESLNREVDLVSEKALKNPYLIDEINATKVKIYG